MEMYIRNDTSGAFPLIFLSFVSTIFAVQTKAFKAIFFFCFVLFYFSRLVFKFRSLPVLV